MEALILGYDSNTRGKNIFINDCFITCDMLYKSSWLPNVCIYESIALLFSTIGVFKWTHIVSVDLYRLSLIQGSRNSWVQKGLWLKSTVSKMLSWLRNDLLLRNNWGVQDLGKLWALQESEVFIKWSSLQPYRLLYLLEAIWQSSTVLFMSGLHFVKYLVLAILVVEQWVLGHLAGLDCLIMLARLVSSLLGPILLSVDISLEDSIWFQITFIELALLKSSLRAIGRVLKIESILSINKA